MFSRFFIDRPIFAAVLSILITLAGAIAMTGLPLAQYPQVTPPTVRVGCTYPGASAEDVAKTVAAPIEEQVNGVENMLYMSSQCANDGSYGLEVTFKQGVNLNMAQVLVQNRVNLALPMLPDVIKQTGVTTLKRSPDILMSVNINSPDGRYDQLYLSNYALMRLKDEVLRLEGVSDLFISGQRDYSMRIWLDPDRLAVRSLTAGDVVRAIREQNREIASGQIGQQPMRPGQETQITLTTLGRLKRPEQFADIVIRSSPEGRLLRIKDVGRVELGARNQDVSCKLDGKDSVGLIIFQLPDANALDVAKRIRAKMDELAKGFPAGLIYEIQYDTTPFTRECIHEVFKSLRLAILLVALVVLLFLQNWRSALIPLISVPVAIIGTFAVLAAFHFSLNILTLFGLVLAIGIVVDNAIVIVESVEHHIEQGLAPREAAIKAMSQVSSPVVAMGLVLSAMFVPCAFIGGITGQFFRQFALTIAASTVLSTLSSLTLSPALAALLLRPRTERHYDVLPRLFYAGVGGWLGWEWGPGIGVWGLGIRDWVLQGAGFPIPNPQSLIPYLAAATGVVLGWLASRPLNFILGWLLARFDRGFRWATGLYSRAVAMVLRVSVLVLVVYGGLLLLTYRGFATTPKGFIPAQDMGYLFLSVQLPDAASAERTRHVMSQIQEICLGSEKFNAARGVAPRDGAKVIEGVQGVKHTLSIAGTSMVLNVSGSYFGFMFVILDDFADRRDPELSAERVAAALQRRCAEEIPDAKVTILPPPPIRGVGRAGGFKLMIEDRGNLGLRSLQQQTDDVAEIGRQKRWPLAGLDDLSPQDRILAEKQRNCPVDGKPLGSKGPPIKLTVQQKEVSSWWAHWGPVPIPKPTVTVKDRTLMVCCDECGKALLADPMRFLPKLKEMPPLLNVAPTVFRADAPQLYVDMNRAQCMVAGVKLADAFETLQVFLGSLYVNDFNLFGRTWQVIVQAEARARNDVERVRNLKVRGATGAMLPMGTIADVREINGPLVLTRYNMYPAAAIQGQPVPGISSRQGIDLLEEVSDKHLPEGMSYEWSELSYLELQAGNTAMTIFAFAVVMVFLVLAAQYESWSLPLAVILVVPICLLAAITGVTAVPAFFKWFHGVQQWVTGAGGGTALKAAMPGPGGGGPGMSAGAVADINIFTQIGFVVLIGLASKNAILIVEFARRRRAAGATGREAAVEACTLRLRPIVMTSFAFILGVSPLLVGHGAGSEMRRTLGTAVFSGMLGVTLFGLFLTPVFFVVVDAMGGGRLARSRLVQWVVWGASFAFNLLAVKFLAASLRLVASLVQRLWRKGDDGKP